MLDLPPVVYRPFALLGIECFTTSDAKSLRVAHIRSLAFEASTLWNFVGIISAEHEEELFKLATSCGLRFKVLLRPYRGLTPELRQDILACEVAYAPRAFSLHSIRHPCRTALDSIPFVEALCVTADSGILSLDHFNSLI